MVGKKTFAGIITVALIITVFLVVWFSCITYNVLEDVDESDISEIVIYEVAESVTLTEKEHIGKVLELLQSMELNNKVDDNADGFLFDIQIKYEDGSDSRIVIRDEETVCVDGELYDAEENYVDDFKALYDKLVKE